MPSMSSDHGSDGSSGSGSPPTAAPDSNMLLANALTALTAILQQQTNTASTSTHTVVLNLYDSDEPFDLSTRAGNTAYSNACAALDQTWDGDVETLPAFTIALQLRAREVGWARQGDTNVLTIAGLNILTDYHQVKATDIEDARLQRTSPRAIQNARTMYHCIKSSISGDLRTILFEQEANIPNEDGPELFFKLTEYSASSSLSLAMTATQRLIHYDPSARNFNIAAVNLDLLSLFTMARSPGSTLTAPQKLHYTLAAYSKIHQPESWAQWVRDQIEEIESGKNVECQTFMNSAVLKQQRIRRNEGAFNGSLSTIRDDVVAMMADVKKTKGNGKNRTLPDKKLKPNDENISPDEKPSFIRHFKTTVDGKSVNYKIGDSKTWKGAKWFFCDCPNHRDKVKWHVHEAKDCNTRKRWIEKKNKPEANRPTAANAVTEDEEQTDAANADAPENEPSPDDHSALLATVMNSVSYNANAQAFIADAIAALQEEQE